MNMISHVKACVSDDEYDFACEGVCEPAVIIRQETCVWETSNASASMSLLHDLESSVRT